MSFDRQKLARKVRGHQAAAARQRAAPYLPASPTDALEQALELWELHPELFDAPVDAVRARELVDVRKAWALLRERLGGLGLRL